MITNESAESILQIKTSVVEQIDIEFVLKRQKLFKLDHIKCPNFGREEGSSLSLDNVTNWDHFFFVKASITIS